MSADESNERLKYASEVAEGLNLRLELISNQMNMLLQFEPTMRLLLKLMVPPKDLLKQTSSRKKKAKYYDFGDRRLFLKIGEVLVEERAPNRQKPDRNKSSGPDGSLDQKEKIEC